MEVHLIHDKATEEILGFALVRDGIVTQLRTMIYNFGERKARVTIAKHRSPKKMMKYWKFLCQDCRYEVADVSHYTL